MPRDFLPYREVAPWSAGGVRADEVADVVDVLIHNRHNNRQTRVLRIEQPAEFYGYWVDWEYEG